MEEPNGVRVDCVSAAVALSTQHSFSTLRHPNEALICAKALECEWKERGKNTFQCGNLLTKINIAIGTNFGRLAISMWPFHDFIELTLCLKNLT